MKIMWNVPKMKCDGCVTTIAETLLMFDRLEDVTVDLESKQVAFEAPDQSYAEEAKRALAKAGFPVA